MHRSVLSLTLITCALSFGLGACASASTTAVTAGAPPSARTNPAPADNSANAIDWPGIYLGTLPCTDCEGIETAMLLRPDGSFQLATRYLGKPGDLRVQHGVITWNAARNQITLTGVTDAPNLFLVGEQQLVQLDLAGQRITGELAARYVLRKQERR